VILYIIKIGESMKKKQLLIFIVSILTIISFAIGISYAYFSTIVIGNDTSSSNIATSGKLRLTFNGIDYINMDNKEPGDFDSMTFTVKNTGTLPISGYQIYFSNVINTFSVKSELVYEIGCVSSDAVSCSGKVETEVPSVSGVSITQTDIAPETTHTYTLTVTFIDTGLLQDYNQGKTILFDITINEQFDIPVLIASTGSADARYFWGYKASITSITFEKGIDVPLGATASWDVSAAQDGSIMAYIMGSTIYDLFFQTDSDFLLSNSNSSYLFYNFTNLTVINNISMLRTYYVINMEEIFENCSSLTSLDLSSFDTSNVTTMYYMFDDCSSLTSLDLSNFNTSSVINMGNMFWDCSSLTNLNLTSFETSNVSNMGFMFRNCSSLTSLNLSSFDTANVTAMGYMFETCTQLLSLNISTFDTAKVTDMGMLFSSCSALISIDLSSFDVSNVTNMSSMFSICSSLTSIDLGSFDTSSVESMDFMFAWCNSLINIDFRLADFTTVTSYLMMFSGITNGITITVLDATAQTWITARLTDASKTGTVVIA